MKKPRNTIPVVLPATVKAWVKAQAEDVGLDPASWLTMQIVLMSKRSDSPQYFETYRGVRIQPQSEPQPEPQPEPVPEFELDAIVGAKLAEAEAAGLAEPAPQPEQSPESAEVRPLRRPPTPFSAQTTPRHLAGIG